MIGQPRRLGPQQIEEWELKKYHQPGDKLDGTWKFDGMIEDAQLDMLSAWLVAQADAMPTWNPGDEFEAAREAIAARRRSRDSWSHPVFERLEPIAADPILGLMAAFRADRTRTRSISASGCSATTEATRRC